MVRCELDGVVENKGEEAVVSIKALNEFDLKATDWRKKLESQRGAVLAFETKNNKNKMAKWTVGALLAGAEQLKLGYVSRAAPRDNQNHVILGVQVSVCGCGWGWWWGVCGRGWGQGREVRGVWVGCVGGVGGGGRWGCVAQRCRGRQGQA